MSALPLTTPSVSETPIGSDLAAFLGIDWDSIRKRFREQKGGKETHIGKTDPLSIEALEIFKKVYKERIDEFSKNWKPSEAKQTPIRKIETPQYKPPPVSREQIEEELKVQYEIRKVELKEHYEKRAQNIEATEKQKTEQLKKEHEAEKQKFNTEIETKSQLIEQLKKQKATEAAQIKEQFTEKLTFSSEKEKLSVDAAIARHELKLRTEFTKLLELEKLQVENDIKHKQEAERQKLIDEYEQKLKHEKQSTGSASATQIELTKQNESLNSALKNFEKRFDEQEATIRQLQSKKIDLENQLNEVSNLDVHQRIEQLRSSIESEYQQKLLLALENAKTEVAAETAKMTAEQSAKNTQEILKIKADSREQVKKEVNIVTQNLKREIQERDNIIRDKDAQLEKAYSDVGIDPTEDVPFTTANWKWTSFTIIAVAAACIFSKYEAVMFEKLFDIRAPGTLVWLSYFILAIIIQLLGVVISVNFNRTETQQENGKWSVAIQPYPIYAIVAMDIIVEVVGVVLEFVGKSMDSRYIIGSILLAIILPVAHYFLSHIILNEIKRRIEERLNYGL